MEVKDQVLAFDWDGGNLDKSRRKHGVTPPESESVFADENSIILPAFAESHGFNPWMKALRVPHEALAKWGTLRRVSPDEARGGATGSARGAPPDEGHSIVEERFAIFGKSDLNRYLYVIFIVRRKKIRIISARRMHREEVKKYAKIKKNT